ncbi:hypothetical protein BVH03_17675 [Pseudomonas sp. PA15(2017)]|uniref:hypothetical protein n=1 Tax=Pseudomonas sp. PA15(2017) TaxID=1932111 RepID=UPI000963668E|nr:hypothetical protein [Pseudomonas sp. PA15(2017)]OLU25484.1 hypothetical protein BVH03_17675 [Pseudomonas sp. PA15(2017)]
MTPYGHLYDEPLLDLADQHNTILACMAELGWTVNLDTKNGRLHIGGGRCGGALNPHGNRVVVAAFDPTDLRWMTLQVGFTDAYEQRISNFPTARSFAQAMHNAAQSLPIEY